MSTYGALVPEPDAIRKWQRKIQEEFPLMSRMDQTGRPKISGYKEVIENILQENHYISLTRVAEKIKLIRYTVRRIIKEEIRFKKVALRWFSYLLMRNIVQKRVVMARIMLVQLQKRRRQNIVSVITGDETFIYYRNPATSAWIKEGQE
ncbi:MAG: hypothetical protein EZS28_028944 [Streblomastix strix]|uniref:Uncharacterized protein n=1 Tax=Streblomastix strix TaxID=222440 RepID=A0A5J4UZH6_9EUKA|nr:MAG: hypothetical protein EZS28_028944 [Streblomastix strix]